jgi:electron transport complex protein RnfE
MGLCPLIGVSASFASGIAVCTATSLGVVAMGLVSMTTRRFVPARLAIPAHLAFAAFYALFAGLLIDLWSPVLAADLGIYVPLIMVNCLIIHEMRRGLAPESPSFHSTLSAAIGYLIVGFMLCLSRESLGSGTLTLPTPGMIPLSIAVLPTAPLPLLLSPAGGFLTLGAFAFLQRLVGNRKRRFGP